VANTPHGLSKAALIASRFLTLIPTLSGVEPTPANKMFSILYGSPWLSVTAKPRALKPRVPFRNSVNRSIKLLLKVTL
jgi:hypothetical protein